MNWAVHRPSHATSICWQNVISLRKKETSMLSPIRYSSFGSGGSIAEYKKRTWNCVLSIVFEGPEKTPLYKWTDSRPTPKPAQEQSMPFLYSFENFSGSQRQEWSTTLLTISFHKTLKLRTLPCFDGKFNDKEWKQEKDWKVFLRLIPTEDKYDFVILTLCIFYRTRIPYFRPIAHAAVNTRAKIRKCQVISIIPKRTSLR